MKDKIYNQKGVTLVELLAAITILTILVVPISQLLVHSQLEYSKDKQKDKALILAQKHLENAKLNQIWLNNWSSYTQVEDNYHLIPYNGDDSPYHIRILMKQSPIDADLIQIKVEAYWKDLAKQNLLTYLVTEVSSP